MDDLTYPLNKPGERVMLNEMLFVVNDEAERVENVEAARVKGGEEAKPSRVRRAEVLRAIARFVVLIEPHMDEIKQLVARGKRR